MTEKLCPVISQGLDEIFCCENKCAWWNSSWDKCNMILEGHIAGFKMAAAEAREY